MIPETVRSFFKLCYRFMVNLGQDFIENGCQKSAAALTYMTLFAIVPLMTVIYFIFSMVPAFADVGERLQDLIFSNFVPETGHEIQSYLANFSQQARSLTGFGVGMLVITAYLMLTNIEKTFNHIWGVDKPRRGLSSFLLYWAVLSIGPILLGVGLAMSTYLLSLKLVMDEFDILGISAFFFNVLPWITTSSAFTLLFAAVPNCRVPFRFALVGGVITALCFELLKNVFGKLVANSSFQLVYGAFAAVPLFLLWINLVWTTILSGAILVRTLSEGRFFRSEAAVTDMIAALKCLQLFYARNKVGGKVSDSDCYRLGLGVVHWQKLRSQLLKNRWIITTASDHYVLARDLREVSLWDLAKIVELRLSDLEASINRSPKGPWFERYMELRKVVESQSKEHFGVPVQSLFE